MKTCIASRGLWAVAILKSLLFLRAGPLRNLVAFQYINTQPFAFFFNGLKTCTYWTAQWRSDLVTADADWHRLNLLTDSTSPETQTQIWNWLRQRPPRTFGVHCLQTVHCCASTMAEQLHPQQPSHDYTICGTYATYEIQVSRNSPIRTALTFRCRLRRLYLSQTQRYQRMLISFEYA